jgi:hypothetical protein
MVGDRYGGPLSMSNRTNQEKRERVMELYRIGDQIHTRQSLKGASIRAMIKDLEPGETFTAECFEPDAELLKRQFRWTRVTKNMKGEPHEDGKVEGTLRKFLRGPDWMWFPFGYAAITALEVGASIEDAGQYETRTMERIA